MRSACASASLIEAASRCARTRSALSRFVFRRSASIWDMTVTCGSASTRSRTPSSSKHRSSFVDIASTASMRSGTAGAWIDLSEGGRSNDGLVSTAGATVGLCSASTTSLTICTISVLWDQLSNPGYFTWLYRSTNSWRVGCSSCSVGLSCGKRDGRKTRSVPPWIGTSTNENLPRRTSNRAGPGRVPPSPLRAGRRASARTSSRGCP